MTTFCVKKGEKMENQDVVKTDLQVRATAALEEEVASELSKPDPDEQTKASFRETERKKRKEGKNPKLRGKRRRC